MAENICDGLLCEKKTAIRCRKNKQTVEELATILQKEKVTVEASKYLPYALEITDYNYLKALKSFLFIVYKAV